MSLGRLKQDWEDLGRIDPLWAILTDPRAKFGKWDVGQFFLTGEEEIGRVMQSAMQLGYPLEKEFALDFGCGVGRVTRALAKYFRLCYGVDISQRMIEKAKEINRSIPGCQFILNIEPHLHIFSTNYFSMIYTNLVLQHVPRKYTIRSYIFEFIRILKNDGLLVFQLPSYIPPRIRLQLNRRLYTILRGIGFSVDFLYKKLDLNPMRMTSISEKEMIAFLNTNSAKLLKIESKLTASPFIQSRTYYVTK